MAVDLQSLAQEQRTIPEAATARPGSPQMSADGLREFSNKIFGSFLRSDQRRLGELYVNGLLYVPGRKTVKKISDLAAGGGVEQRLQQFVNQSPWDWSPVRRELANQVAAALQPHCWVVKEVVFPKNGERSVGVAKQFSHSAGRTLNCQRGIAVFLAGPLGCFPVNWRLMLPKSWDTDQARRDAVRVPSSERYAPAWHHMLSAVEEMVEDWGLVPAPVLADLRFERSVVSLAHGLEALGVRYALKVAEGRPATIISSQRTLTFADVISRSLHRDPHAAPTWNLPSEHSGVSSLLFTEVPAGGGDPAPGRQLYPGRPLTAVPRLPRYVAAEWSTTRRAAKVTWLTTLDAHFRPSLTALTMLSREADAELERLYTDTGLLHFEGRSFPGWHHYVTLVSIARAWSHLLGRTPDDLQGQNLYAERSDAWKED